MSIKPKPYDLTKPEELDRLIMELTEYMEVSLTNSTDLEDLQARKYAYEALLFLKSRAFVLCLVPDPVSVPGRSFFF